MSKSSKIKKLIKCFIGIFIVIGLVYFSFIILISFFSFLENANPSISAAIVGAMATILVGIGGVLYTQAQIKKREIEEAHRSKKIEIYKDFLDVVARIMAKENQNISLQAPSDQELVDFLVEFKTNVILWGAPKVINAHLKFESASRHNENVLFAVDDLYKAIREDIGLSNKGLNNHQLIKMYLKDPDELDK